MVYKITLQRAYLVGEKAQYLTLHKKAYGWVEKSLWSKKK